SSEEDGARTYKQTATCRRAQSTSTSSTMSSLVALLLVTLVTQSCAAPQRRNWTPQAMLYLKGAQGHRSVLERPSRDEGDSVHLVTHGQSSGGLGLSLASSILLELLQRAVVEGGDYPEEQQLKLNYL
ncbi:hypothetical protein INR49_025014, partial [Caranx melampygus]